MKRVKFLWTNSYDEGEPNCGFDEEWDYEIFEDDRYTFEDYLIDNEVTNFEIKGSVIFLLDEEDNPTGEAYKIIEEKIF